MRKFIYVAIVMVLLYVPILLWAQETITIQPAARISWSELERLDALRPAASAARPKVIPFMPAPQPGEIGSLPGIGMRPDKSVMPPEFIPKPEGFLEGLFAIPPASLNFQALPDNNMGIPPDVSGAAGPGHLMTMLNTQVRIQNKTGGIISTVSLNTFWSSLTGDPFDPHIVYDSINNRWIATCSADGNSATSQVFFAISATNNPTGVWTFYQFMADPAGTTWADYPGFGVNSTWIAITHNMFTVAAAPSFVGAKMRVIDKSTALAGGALTVTVFPTGFDQIMIGAFLYRGFTLKPCRTFDAAQPNLYIVDYSGVGVMGGNQAIRISQITGTGPTPSWSVTPGGLGSAGLFVVANNFNPNQIDAAQKGTASLVFTNEAGMQDPVFRNGRIWCTHSGGLPVAPAMANRTAAFWYQLNPTALPAPIIQSGVLDEGVGVHVFFPSITANTTNDACIGFSRSDASKFVEAAYTGRFSTDPPNTMRPIKTLKCGEDSYIKDGSTNDPTLLGRIRWGDYSATVVDPSDNLSFWTIQEYAALDVGPGELDDRWGTWWGKVTLPVGPPPVIMPSVTSYASLAMPGTSVTLNLHPEVWCGSSPPSLQFYCNVIANIPAGSDACQICDILATAINTDPACQSLGFSAFCSGDVVRVSNSRTDLTCPAPFVCFDPTGLTRTAMAVDMRFLEVDMPMRMRISGLATGNPIDRTVENRVIVKHIRRPFPTFVPIIFTAEVRTTPGMSPEAVVKLLADNLQSKDDNKVKAEGPILIVNPDSSGQFRGAGAFDLTVGQNDNGLGFEVSPVNDLVCLLTECVLGDVSRDKRPTILDALLIATDAVRLPIPSDILQEIIFTCGDVTLDRKTDIVDALVVANFAVGLQPPFPVGRKLCPR